jgi:PleD family two-component response regulator
MTVKVGAGAEIKRNHGLETLSLTLDQVAQRLVSTYRKSDHVARLSEQTFVVLMPGATCEEVQHVGERIERALDDLAPLGGDAPQGLGIVLGMANLQPSDTAESIIRRAEVEGFHAASRADIAVGVG